MRSEPGFRRRLALIALALLVTTAVVPPVTCAAELHGAEFRETYRHEDTELSLAGLGLLRYRYFIKVYVAALYLAAGIPPERALDDVPRRLEFHYRHAIEKAISAKATIEAIRHHSGEAAVARFREQIDALNALYDDVEAGDRYALTYFPERGTELSLNGVAKGVVEGAEFARALFAIWLGEKPVSTSMRAGLLGLD